MFLPGQHAPSGQLHLAGGFLSHPGQIVLQALFVGIRYGASQKPIAAKHAHTVFSAGQHVGHSLPGVKTGFSPALQNESWAKHLQVGSGVLEMFCPGQQESHSHLALK